MSADSHADRRLLATLERELEALERSGVRWLSVAPDPTAAAPVERSAYRPPEASEAAAPARAAAAPPKNDKPTLGEPQVPMASRPSESPPQPAVAGDPGEASPHPSALDTLESLRFQYRDCQNCKLGGSRTHLVFGVGSDRPRLMFIGEGPGADEDEQGLPFVGRAGKLLTGLIEAMGLVRDDVYITNVVKCRPPGNRNPEPDEVASCRPILQRQIELLNPRLIVTLGNVPLKVLRPEAGGITRERGRPFTYQRWQVLPTFHPSYLLRNPSAIETCWPDFRKALQMAYVEE
ncbi:MAG TPA: uracil-DNA glycosylase [bacterium]|nr:uracil-DNA glycosylase [bacterium]